MDQANQRDDAGLCSCVGLVLQSGPKGRVCVQHLLPGGAAAASDTVKEGDAVMKVNRLDLSKSSVEEVELLLVGDVGGEICIIVQKDSGETWEAV